MRGICEHSHCMAWVWDMGHGHGAWVAMTRSMAMFKVLMGTWRISSCARTQLLRVMSCYAMLCRCRSSIVEERKGGLGSGRVGSVQGSGSALWKLIFARSSGAMVVLASAPAIAPASNEVTILFWLDTCVHTHHMHTLHVLLPTDFACTDQIRHQIRRSLARPPELSHKRASWSIINAYALHQVTEFSQRQIIDYFISKL